MYCIFLNVQVARLNKARKVKLDKGTSEEIVAVIDKLTEDFLQQRSILNKTCEIAANLEKESKSHIKKIGLERYDIGDTSGNQSFSLALLNSENEGVVIRGMFTRETSRFYCVKIDKDGTDKQLQEEDIKALKKALNQ